MGADAGAEGSGGAEEDPFEEPDAADAGDALDGEVEGGSAVGGGEFSGVSGFGEPCVVAFLEGDGFDWCGDFGAFEIVVLVEAAVVDELVDEGAAAAAEFVCWFEGIEVGAAVFAEVVGGGFHGLGDVGAGGFFSASQNGQKASGTVPSASGG